MTIKALDLELAIDDARETNSSKGRAVAKLPASKFLMTKGTPPLTSLVRLPVAKGGKKTPVNVLGVRVK